MKKQVAKSQIFTKESLTRIQDKMRNCCIKSFNKVYEQDYQLKTKENGEVFGTRASIHQYEIVKKKLPQVQYDEVSKILKIEKTDKKLTGRIAVCSAGTADIPVAEEAAQTAEFFGTYVDRIYDVGVSGLHRLLSKMEVMTLTRHKGLNGFAR